MDSKLFTVALMALIALGSSVAIAQPREGESQSEYEARDAAEKADAAESRERQEASERRAREAYEKEKSGGDDSE